MKLLQTIGLFILLIFATGSLALAEENTSSDSNTAAPGKTVTDSPAKNNSYFGKNLVVLASQTWKDIGLLFAKILKAGILWGSGLALCGFILGLALWFILRKNGVFALPYGWYRYVRWVWCIGFVTCFTLGFGYAGTFWGFGKAINHGILHDRIADKTVANLYVAAALDAADYELKGTEKLEELQTILKQSEQLSKIVSTNLGQFIRQATQTNVATKIDPSKLKMLALISDSTVGNFVLSHMAEDVDAWVAISALYALSINSPEGEAFLKDNPDASMAKAAILSFLDVIRTELCKFVSSVMLSQAIAGIIGGPAIPLGLLVLLVIYRKCFVKTAVIEQKEAPAGVI